MPRTVGPKFPIVITSYEIAMNDARKCFGSYSWKYLVVDEVPSTILFSQQSCIFDTYISLFLLFKFYFL
jgi:hypothetical protein